MIPAMKSTTRSATKYRLRRRVDVASSSKIHPFSHVFPRDSRAVHTGSHMDDGLFDFLPRPVDSASSTPDWPQRDGKDFLDYYTRKARSLFHLDDRIRRSCAERCKEALHILNYFKQNHSILDPDTINLVINLLELLVIETASARNIIHGRGLTHPKFLNSILSSIWKEPAKKNHNIISPHMLLKKLQHMATKNPVFRYDTVTIGILLDVLIARSKRHDAPKVAEDFLGFVQSNDSLLVEFHPDIYIFNQLLRAWTLSRLPETPSKLDEILQIHMRDQGLTPDEVSYAIILSYWAKQGAHTKLDELLERMERESVEPTLIILSQAVYGYAKANKIQSAEKMLLQMVQKQQMDDSNDQRLIAAGTQQILLAYKRLLSSYVKKPSQDNEQIQKVVEDAEATFQQMEKTTMLAGSRKVRILTSMMEIYALARMHDRVEGYLKRIKLDKVQWTILIKSYGKHGKAEFAAAILESMLRQDSLIHPDVTTFNSVIKYVSSHPFFKKYFQQVL